MASRNTKPFLVTREVFRTDEPVPRTGVYEVIHAEHRLPHEVTVFAGQVFPRCAKCASEVTFRLVRAVPELDQREFRVWLHAIPPVDTEVAVTPERKAS